MVEGRGGEVGLVLALFSLAGDLEVLIVEDLHRYVPYVASFMKLGQKFLVPLGEPGQDHVALIPDVSSCRRGKLILVWAEVDLYLGLPFPIF